MLLLLLHGIAQHWPEDIGVSVVFVPGEFIYDVPLDCEHPVSQVCTYMHT